MDTPTHPCIPSCCLAEFLAMLPLLLEEFHWFEDEMGMVRGHCAATPGEWYVPLTALAYVRTGTFFSFGLDWEQAAQALGLSREDASAITSAEDQDQRHDPVLARALREALALLPSAEA